MNSRTFLTLALAASFLGSTVCAQARDKTAYADDSPDAMAADALIARPAGLVSTIIGTGLFVATLPLTLISGSTHKAAKSLVGVPANLTFKRKLGKLSQLED